MKIIQLDQRSPEWHDWRNGKDIDGPRITASNVAVIAGISPFKSRVTLWEEMTGRKAPDPMNPAMAHGVKTEDEALAAWIQDYGDYAQPCCIEQEEHPWIAASLDGLTLTGTKAVEVKCPWSKYGDPPKLWVEAEAGRIPDYYVAQMQWQMLASDGEIQAVDFWVYWSGKGIRIEVFPDLKMQQELFEHAHAFRQCVLDDQYPADQVWFDAANAWRRAKLEFDAAKSYLDSCSADLERLLELEKRPSYEGCGIVATRYSRKGAVDYEALFAEIETLHGIRLADMVDQFRKPDAESFKVTFQRKAPAPTAVPGPTQPQPQPSPSSASMAEHGWF